MSDLVQSMVHEVADPLSAAKLRDARSRTIQLACVLGAACIAASVWAWMPMRQTQLRAPRPSTVSTPVQAPVEFRMDGFQASAWQAALPVVPAAPLEFARPQVQLVGLMHDPNTQKSRAALYDIATGQLEVLAQGDTALCGWTLHAIDATGVTLRHTDTPSEIRLEMERNNAAQSHAIPGGSGTP